MAKKEEKKNVPLTQIPLSIAGLSKKSGLSDITKNVNSDILEPKDEQENNSEVGFRGKGGGRPAKLDEEIVPAQGGSEWEQFMDYAAQFYAKKNPGEAVYINEDIKTFFTSLKLVSDSKIDIRSSINAALKLFVEKYKDDINNQIREKLIQN